MSDKDIAKDRADWLLDAVACATQNRQFLRGDPAYDEVAGEAILLNGEKAINVALSKKDAEITRLRAALADAQARSYTLAVAIMGGEDAPGLADATDAESLADQLGKERAARMENE